jgi:gliding motility-associated-like protein
LSAINCPNNLGAACGFQTCVIANQTGGGGSGLPKWVYYADDAPISNFQTIIFNENCFGANTQFWIADTTGISNITWNFGDTNSGANNTAVGDTAFHTFSQIGIYNVQAILTTTCGFDTLFTDVAIVNPCNNITPTITGIKLVGDTCNVPSNLSLQAEGISSSPYFFWNFGDPASGVNDTTTITGLSTSPFPLHSFSSAGIYNVCVSFQEPGLPISTVCRTISIGLCCNGLITSNDSCLQNNIPFSITTDASISSVTWNFSDPSSGTNNTSTSLTPTHLFSATGNYNITANIIATCGILKINYPLQIVNCSTNCTGTISSNDTCLLNGTSFQVVSNNTINSTVWTFGDPSSGANNTSTSLTPTYLFSATGTYNVRAIVNFSCGVDTIIKTLSIVKCDSLTTGCQLQIPTAFTPNGDDTNDNFYPLTNCETERYEFAIFNRWGEIIFKTSNQSDKWDGKYKGTDCPVEVYVYFIKYKFPTQPIKNAYGSITLLR